MTAESTSTVTLSTERSQRTRRAILTAATRCFGTHGYANVSMEAIAEDAGVTKPTVYAHFGSKEGLFETLLHETFRGMKEDPPAEVATREEFEQVLLTYAEHHMEMLLDDAILGLLRATAAEAMRRPEWAQELLPRILDDAFERWLERASRKGLISASTPEVAAETFWSLVKGPLFYPVLVGIRPKPEADERQRVVEEAVRVFLDAHAV